VDGRRAHGRVLVLVLVGMVGRLVLMVSDGGEEAGIESEVVLEPVKVGIEIGGGVLGVVAVVVVVVWVAVQ
jgi:hypothetical protein